MVQEADEDLEETELLEASKSPHSGSAASGWLDLKIMVPSSS